MSISHMSADDIIEQIETANIELKRCEQEVAHADANFKAMETAKIISYRDTGLSMTESERRAKDNLWANAYARLQSLNIAAAAAKRDYQIAIYKLDAWRTERATMRAIG